MVKAAGVEPVQDVENNQVVDSNNGKNGKKGRSTVQTLYKISSHDRPATRSASPKYPP